MKWAVITVWIKLRNIVSAAGITLAAAMTGTALYKIADYNALADSISEQTCPSIREQINLNANFGGGDKRKLSLDILSMQCNLSVIPTDVYVRINDKTKYDRMGIIIHEADTMG